MAGRSFQHSPNLLITRVALLLATAAALISLSAAAAPLIGVPSVIDGDTIEIHGQRIRLNGIAAPESAQLCGLGTMSLRPEGVPCSGGLSQGAPPDILH